MRIETLLEQFILQVDKRLHSHDEATTTISAKLDTVISNQASGAVERETIRQDILAMKPHIKTVEDVKRLTVWGKWTLGLGAASIGTVAAVQGWYQSVLDLFSKLKF